MYAKLPRSFYERDPLIVSRELLGKFLVRKSTEGKIIGKIVETEAYIGPYDKASHAYNNRKTKRTIVQFGERGHAYIYRIYGIYYCFCIVVGPKYIPAVVLIRAVEPIQGVELMRRNRGLSNEIPITELTNGPSKVCQAFGLTTELHGIDLCGEELFICGGDEALFEVGISKRIGVDYAEEYKEAPWRFYIKSNKFVSRKPRE
jgi:DNA-3-methyladenine glycosylase